MLLGLGRITKIRALDKLPAGLASVRRQGSIRILLRVPKEIIWGHGGLWSDNSVAMLAAIFRIHFPLTAEGQIAPPPPRLVPKTPDLEGLKQERLH